MEDIKIIPYVYFKDQWSLSYDIIKYIWSKMVNEGTNKVVFYAGSVRTFEQFHSFLQTKGNSVVTIWDKTDIIFIGWINSFSENSACGHFNCFKKTWGKTSVDLCKISLKYFFSFPFLDTIIGVTPLGNRLAIKMALACGGKRLGVIPNYSTNFYTKKKTDVMITFVEREV